ncbi:DUF6541 family protein [Kutzneria albida]|uniref:Putative membrane protein n=1 Tax=Kutzneria albida DSM 43870 TaxID=1449976 RepID=W5VY93_9PSEU|nr:DUF6541 family protein [Kutzneria albida]AHH93537.1 putative membrane protein [Kutzneria albida DSM 43870]
MTWLDAVPLALVCAAWLILPGLPVTYLAGLRGITAVGVAPAVTVAVTGVSAVAANKLGIGWSVWVPLVSVLGLAVLVGLGALLLRRRFQVVRPADPRGLLVAALLGLVPVLVIGSVILVKGMGRPEELAQTFDTVFHYNAVGYILDSGNASSLTLGTLGLPGLGGSFYPGAWHDLVSLAVLSTGAGIPAASNLMAGVLAVVVWPLSCMVLVRQVIGRSVAAMACTGVVSIAFSTFPWGLLGFGVLWPNTLGMTVAPIGIAAVLSLSGLATDDALGKARAWPLLGISYVAAGLAHPNVVFSMTGIGFFAVLTGALRRSIGLYREGRRARAFVGPVVVVVLFGAVWWWAAHASVFEPIRRSYWPPFESPAQAVGEALLNAQNNRTALWALSAVVLVGIVLAKRYRALRWVVAGHALSIFLFVVAASMNRPDTAKFTGFWYNDSYRLAAMLPITGVPLVVAALLWAATKTTEWGKLPRLGGLLRSVTGLTVVLAALLVVATKGLYFGAHAESIKSIYAGARRSADSTLVSDRELAFFQRIKDKIPADAMVANNPWDGTVMMPSLIGRKTIGAQLLLDSNPAYTYLAQHLVDVARDPQVCRYAKQLGVGYLVIGDGTFWSADGRRLQYPGTIDPGRRPGFQLLDSDGPMKLFRITACGTG